MEGSRTEVGAGQQVCTRPAVARFMLDLAGYTADRPLHRLRFVDPAAGPGVFFLEALDRLLAAWRADPDARIEQLAQAVRGVEIDAAIVGRLRARVRARLSAAGFAPSDVERLVQQWCVEADFLAPGDDGPVDVIAGNPPFRRYDALSGAERTRFQQQFTTFGGRCDLYVIFVERALSLLAEGGTLAVITPDRWQRAQYGAKLRKLVAEGYHLRAQVDATAQPVFTRDVAAYPGISVISRSTAGPTRLARIQ